MITQTFPLPTLCLVFQLYLLVFHGISMANSSNETDLHALIAIKAQIQSLSSSSWNQYVPFCHWQGIICSHRHQRVISLNISSQNLVGTISPYIGNLSFLKYLHLGNNRLSGQIPATLGKLTSLRIFSVDSNKLSGEVPLSVYNMSFVHTFRIADNQLTGSLPPNIGFLLPNLVHFTAGLNKLSGILPVSLPNASKLQHFDVVSNHFIGDVPAGLGVAQNFKWLNLADNFLGTGRSDDLRFISSLLNSSNLKGLSLSKNNFGGVFPTAIVNLSVQMEKLYLGGNQISGTIPDGIVNLASLIALGLENNLLSGSIPSSIGTMQKLQGLSLQGNRFTGLIPSSLGNLSQLFELSLANNQLQGKIPSSLKGCRMLQSLSLARNNLNGTIPEEVIGLSSLSQWLNLSHNFLTGSIPSVVGELRNIALLDLSENKLSGRIPSELGSCKSLEGLHLGNNLLEGTIPESLTTLRGLQILDLSSNNLSGPIPKFERLPDLVRLNLSFNDLSGNVPLQGIFLNASAISVARNPELCGGIQELQLRRCKVEVSRKRKFSGPRKFSLRLSVHLKLQLVTGIYLALVTFIACVIIIITYVIRLPNINISFPRASTFRREPKRKGPTPKIRAQYSRVSYKSLFNATGGFSPSNIVGSGRYSRVYRGTLKRYNMIVAVKVFKLELSGASKSFMDECESLGTIRHRNVVKVLTSCSSTDFEGNEFKALVYELMPNGSLENWLHRAVNGRLNLIQRLNIATDIAMALGYLQHLCSVPVVHRDIKPSNVLLDRDMVAHVSDFGLAKLLPKCILSFTEHLSESAGNSHTRCSSFAVMGSIGYCAPEYGMGSEVSIEGDVYSFGILLLEMFIGKRPTDDTFQAGVNLHSYACSGLQNQVLQIVDPILLSEEGEPFQATYSIRTQNDQRVKLEECLVAVIRIGVACSLESPKDRMDMREVTKKLHSIKDSLLCTRIQEEVT